MQWIIELRTYRSVTLRSGSATPRAQPGILPIAVNKYCGKSVAGASIQIKPEQRLEGAPSEARGQDLVEKGPRHFVTILCLGP